MTPEIQTINLGFVNCYLVNTSDGFILFDTGIPSQRGSLEEALLSKGCTPGNLKLIVVTHGDIDHTGNCAYLREKYNTKIAMHRNDAPMVQNGKMRPKRKVKSPLLRIMHMVMRITGATNKMAAEFDRFTPDLDLEEGQSLKEYGFDATVLHIPGHSRGSIAILTTNGELISGDTLENRDGPHATKIIENEDELNTSLGRLAKLSLKTVYPGHGKPFPWEQFAKHYPKNNNG